MSLHSPPGPLLDSLREILRKMEADPEPETPNVADLKRILRERISQLEAAHSLQTGTKARPATGAGPQSAKRL